jgi:hypothetical protein
MVAAVLIAALAAAVLAAPESGATVPPKRCGEITVKNRDYRIGGHLIRCRFARKQSRQFLRSGDHRDGWSCIRYDPDVTDIVFTCRKGSKDYYAVRL